MSGPAIEVERLVKRFGDTVAVDGISFRVEPGECVGLLGPNGAGKTTTLEILEGLQAPTAGTVRVLGHGWEDSAHLIRPRIAIQLQETRFRDKLTVEEVIRLFRSFYPSGGDVESALDMVSLRDKRKSQVGTLSGGQRQRLGLAVCLVSNPDILFLDEPTTGLDPHSRQELWALIKTLRRRGLTLLLTTHYMEEAQELCDRLIIVDKGKVIASGTPASLVSGLQAGAVIELAARPTLPIERLRAVAGVLDARESGADVRLAVQSLHATLPALLKVAAEHGCELTRLATRDASLNDVFLQMTGRNLREAEESAPAPTERAGGRR